MAVNIEAPVALETLRALIFMGEGLDLWFILQKALSIFQIQCLIVFPPSNDECNVFYSISKVSLAAT